MIQDQTLDETLVELTRTLKALQVLRAARKSAEQGVYKNGRWTLTAEHAAAKRATLDLTRKLADLRAGR